jgi:hypothetical protein
MWVPAHEEESGVSVVRVDNAFLDDDSEQLIEKAKDVAAQLDIRDDAVLTTIRRSLAKAYVIGLTKGIEAAGGTADVIDEP